MPLSKVNYANTIIYRIFSDDCDYVYVGSTTNFVARKAKHKSNCNTQTDKSHLKVYETIRANGGWDAFKMLEVEQYACENSKQSQKREQYWIDFYKSNLNSKNAYKKEEYVKQYNDEHKEEYKQYRIKHSEENIEYAKEYYQEHKKELNQKITCECGAIVSKQYLTRHKKLKKHLEAV